MFHRHAMRKSLRRLNSTIPDDRREAALGLARYKDREAFQALWNCLGDRDFRVRAAAADSIQRAKWKLDAKQCFFMAVRIRDWALALSLEPKIGWLTESLLGEPQEFLDAAVLELARHAGAEAFDWLLTVLDASPYPNQRDASILVAAKGADVAPLLIDILGRSPFSCCTRTRDAFARETLLKMGPEAWGSLEKALLSESPSLRIRAAEILSQMNWESKDEPLHAAYSVGRGDWAGVIRSGSASTPFLCQEVRERGLSDERRQRVVEALGEIQDPRAIPTLADAATDWALAESVLKVLPRFGAAAFDALAEALERDSTCAAALDGLKSLGDRRAIPLLSKTILNILSDAPTIRSAFEILASAMGSEGEEALAALLRDKKVHQYHRQEVIIAALESLSYLPAKLVPGLVSILPSYADEKRERLMNILKTWNPHWHATEDAKAARPNLEECLAGDVPAAAKRALEILGWLDWEPSNASLKILASLIGGDADSWRILAEEDSDRIRTLIQKTTLKSSLAVLERWLDETHSPLAQELVFFEHISDGDIHWLGGVLVNDDTTARCAWAAIRLASDASIRRQIADQLAGLDKESRRKLIQGSSVPEPIRDVLKALEEGRLEWMIERIRPLDVFGQVYRGRSDGPSEEDRGEFDPWPESGLKIQSALFLMESGWFARLRQRERKFESFTTIRMWEGIIEKTALSETERETACLVITQRLLAHELALI